MINYDDITKENIKKHKYIGKKFLIIHTDLEEQTHYLIR